MTPWMIYFARCVAANGSDMGAIKIGCSWRPNHRLRDIARNEPYELELMATCAGDLFQEGAVHMWFRRHRIGGEFFHDHSDIRTFATEAGRLGHVPLSISEEWGTWLTCDEVRSFMSKHRITLDQVAAASGSRVASCEAALKKTQPNRRLVAAVCVVALQRGIPVVWSDFRAAPTLERAA